MFVTIVDDDGGLTLRLSQRALVAIGLRGHVLFEPSLLDGVQRRRRQRLPRVAARRHVFNCRGRHLGMVVLEVARDVSRWLDAGGWEQHHGWLAEFNLKLVVMMENSIVCGPQHGGRRVDQVEFAVVETLAAPWKLSTIELLPAI